jgi:hypothetical protein
MFQDVFISHSTKDKAFANAVCAILEDRKILRWFALCDILLSQSWMEAIVEAIGANTVMVVIVSSDSNNFGQVQREVDQALKRGIAECCISMSWRALRRFRLPNNSGKPSPSPRLRSTSCATQWDLRPGVPEPHPGFEFGGSPECASFALAVALR